MAEAQAEPVDVTSAQDKGVLLQVLKPGEGFERPCPGDKVNVHYTGKLQDGTIFDSTQHHHHPFEFILGKGEVIKGWDLALTHMRMNEEAQLTIAPAYAYGSRGMGPSIPPNSTLIFDIKLLWWTGPDLTKKKDGGVIKKVLRQGEKYATPNDGATVTIKYTGKLEGVVFEEREVTFIQGEGEDKGIIAGLEVATLKMKQGEIDQLTVEPKYAYGQKGHKDLGIPPNATLVYTVEMLSFEKAKESWEMDAGEKIEQSKIIKEKGTVAFKKKNMKRALNNYAKIVLLLEHETSGLQGNEPEERRQLLMAARLNMAQCYLNTNMHREAEDACNKVLEMDGRNVKAYYRRGQAKLGCGEYSEAAKDFRQVLILEPENKAAKNQVVRCEYKEQVASSQQKALYSNMFRKMEEENSKCDGSDTMPEVGEWNNDMAKNMMPLQEERDAFEDGVDADMKKDGIPCDVLDM